MWTDSPPPPHKKRHPRTLGLDHCYFGYRAGASMRKHFLSSSFEKSVTLTFERMVAEAPGDFGGSPQRLWCGATLDGFGSGPK
jgi:hypothetical protein